MSDPIRQWQAQTFTGQGLTERRALTAAGDAYAAWLTTMHAPGKQPPFVYRDAQGHPVVREYPPHFARIDLTTRQCTLLVLALVSAPASETAE